MAVLGAMRPFNWKHSQAHLSSVPKNRTRGSKSDAEECDFWRVSCPMADLSDSILEVKAVAFPKLQISAEGNLQFGTSLLGLMISENRCRSNRLEHCGREMYAVGNPMGDGKRRVVALLTRSMPVMN